MFKCIASIISCDQSTFIWSVGITLSILPDICVWKHVKKKTMKTVKWATSEDNGDNGWSLQETTMVLPRAKARNNEVFSRHVIF
jgi:hypothetical protein